MHNTPMMNLWLRRLALPLALFVGLMACVTPSVPIPPPSPENVYFSLDGAEGTATFSYGPDASYGGAVVYVFNRDVGGVIITTAAADGSVAESEPFAAMAGDEVVVTFELGEELSSTCLVLQDGPSNSGLECEQ